MLERIKAFHHNSLTLGYASFLATISIVMEVMVQLPDIFEAVGMKDYIPPAYLGRYTLAITVLMIGARLRSILRHEGE